MSPRGPLGSSKNQKPVFIKKWFSHGTVGIFSLLRPPKRASRGPRRLPRGTQGAPKPQKKGIQKLTQTYVFFVNFGFILGPILGPKIGSKFVNFWVNFGSLFLGFRSSLGGLKSEKMQTVQRENHFFENVAFLVFEALDGPLGLILPSLWPIWSENGSQNGPQKRSKK